MKNSARILRHPVRLKIVEQLRLRNVAAISELASEIGESTHSLHYHFKILQQGGLIRICSKRTANHRSETVYSLCAPDIKLSRSSQRQDSSEALLAFAIGALELAKGELNDVSMSAEIANVTFARWVGRLSPAQVERVNQLIAEIKCEFASPKGEAAFTFTVGLVPHLS